MVFFVYVGLAWMQWHITCYTLIVICRTCNSVNWLVYECGCEMPIIFYPPIRVPQCLFNTYLFNTVGTIRKRSRHSFITGHI